MIKVILAEDHIIVRNGIKALLERDPEIEVIAEASTGKETLEKISTGLQADIILSDVNMPDLDGILLIQELKKVKPTCKIIILSMLDQDNYVQQAFLYGASGYLLKKASEEELIFAIKHVMAGNYYICSEISMRSMGLVPNTDPKPERSDELTFEISQRESEVLKLIAEGLTNSEIGEKLFTSKRTVEGYRQSLLEKTGANNTATLIRIAMQKRIIQ
ncbi:response regulator transcription factor [Desertivirga xinjiangensis]|uniref:response regulator transcription factor n=1 Tax=Desertivirga xinjiangensis TaxID=539206 RepID=UPI00210D4175|nr:response regulator transcription factor [Pedobacter xinjiangensis]